MNATLATAATLAACVLICGCASAQPTAAALSKSPQGAVNAYCQSFAEPGPVKLPGGIVYLGETIDGMRWQGVTFEGVGRYAAMEGETVPNRDVTKMGGTKLVWTGPPDQPMMRLANARDCTIRDLTFERSDGGVCLEITHGNNETGTNRNHVRDCNFFGGVGIRFGTPGGANNNAADSSITGCYFKDYVTAIRAIGTQRVNYWIAHCEFDAHSKTGSVAIDCQGGGAVTVHGVGAHLRNRGTFLRVTGDTNGGVFFDLAGIRFDRTWSSKPAGEDPDGWSRDREQIVIDATGALGATTFAVRSMYYPLRFGEPYSRNAEPWPIFRLPANEWARKWSIWTIENVRAAGRINATPVLFGEGK